MTRPRHLNEAVATLSGAAAFLVLGLLSPLQAAGTLAAQWNLLLFLTGLMLIAGLADAAGFFDAAAALAASSARGSGRLLLLAIFAVGALVTVFFSNDATALILTPVVYTLTTRLRLPPLPYLFATTFVADTASLTLPVSNPVNVLISDSLRLNLVTYAGHLLLASLLAVALNAGLFLILFRRQLRQRFEPSRVLQPPRARAEQRLFALTTSGLALIALAYVAASLARFPLGLVAIAGSLLLAGVAVVSRGFQPQRVREHFSLTLLGYVSGLLLLVKGVELTGLTAGLVRLLVGLAQTPATAAAAGLVGAAVGSNVLNNLPASLVLISGAQAAQLPGSLLRPFLLGSLAGADIGPNLTPAGSLSTMLWLLIVRRRGLEVSARQYIKIGIMVTPAVLLTAGIALAVSFR
ncbi:MAG: SLC13 family permease [Candidatus Dormibacteraeota bacterium]|nr:SLC13 family permease [Candidatus Dormibacteraeota bacterium]